MTRSFSTTSGNGHNEQFSAQGGRLTMTASQGSNNDTVPVSMTNAFDWWANTQAGANVFNGMLGYAQTRENQLRAVNPGLPVPNGVQRENNALSMYNTGTAVSNLYYAVNASTSPPSWVVNTNNTRGVGYADSVRAQVVPN